MRFFVTASVFFALTSANALSDVRYDVINASNEPLTFELKGAGSQTLPPGTQSWFSYKGPSREYEASYSCRNTRSEVRCGSRYPDELTAVVYSGKCEISIGRLNNQIKCS